MKRAFAALAVVAVFAGARDASAQCKGRPTDAGGVQGYVYAPAEAKSFATERARVHWATSGTHAPDLATTRGDAVPDIVAHAGTLADDALKRWAEQGFRAPPSDAACASNGGDAKIDVYLVRFAGADGATVSESCTGAACSSFVMVDSTFAGRGYPSPKEGFTTVVTHELFHAVQNAYDAELDRFWAEGTAQWAMNALHPELVDFEKQLPAFFAEPTRSLDTAPSGVTAGFLYGSGVWPLFLELARGEGFVREVLEAEAAGAKAVPAIEAVLTKRGSSLAETYPLFAAWNAATKDRAGTGGYPAASTYPAVKTSPLADGASGITAGLGYQVYLGQLTGPSKVSLETDAARNGGMLVPLEGGKARIDKAAKLPAVGEGDVLVVVAGVTAKKTDAPYTLRIAPDEGEGTSSSSSSSGGGSPAEEDSGCGVAGARRGDAVGAIVGALAILVARRRRRAP